jgi:aspartate carbamoyltransferase regulatory subunit
MTDIQFYKDKEDVVFDLHRIIQLAELIKSLNLESTVISKAEEDNLHVFVPANTINAVKTLVFKTGKHKHDESIRAILNCATSPKRPGLPPLPYPQ